jgi:hypothetical protein
MGLILKLERKDSYGSASFCGIVCDPRNKQLVKDPLKVLRNFFTLHKKYTRAKELTHKALLRAKALSYKFMFPHSPIVGTLCDRILLETRGVDVRNKLSTFEPHKREMILLSIAGKSWQTHSCPELSTRLCCEEQFGVTVCEQLRLEHEISSGNFNLSLSHFATAQDVSHLQRHVHRTEISDVEHREYLPFSVWSCLYG